MVTVLGITYLIYRTSVNSERWVSVQQNYCFLELVVQASSNACSSDSDWLCGCGEIIGRGFNEIQYLVQEEMLRHSRTISGRYFYRWNPVSL